MVGQPATVQRSAHYRNVRVWQMDSSELMCANCKTATASQPSISDSEESADDDEDELDSDGIY